MRVRTQVVVSIPNACRPGCVFGCDQDHGVEEVELEVTGHAEWDQGGVYIHGEMVTSPRGLRVCDLPKKEQTKVGDALAAELEAQSVCLGGTVAA